MINPGQRDFSSISPSAKLLLLLKGITDIPFARQAAALISQPEEYQPDYTIKDLGFWTSTVHFERRYKSIDQLLTETPVKNIMELSSGFSLRGLNAVRQSGIHYIDTDLENVIEIKREIIAALQTGDSAPGSELEILPLNALDETQFNEVASRFPAGEIVVINEGLLVYLNRQEKEKLCGIIHGMLKRRGGYWITADVYVKSQNKKATLNRDAELQQFFDRHQIDENKFESFDEAERFFRKAGFIVDKEAQSDNKKITSLRYLLEAATDEQLQDLRQGGKIQATWRLKVAAD